MPHPDDDILCEHGVTPPTPKLPPDACPTKEKCSQLRQCDMWLRGKGGCEAAANQPPPTPAQALSAELRNQAWIFQSQLGHPSPMVDAFIDFLEGKKDRDYQAINRPLRQWCADAGLPFDHQQLFDAFVTSESRSISEFSGSISDSLRTLHRWSLRYARIHQLTPPARGLIEPWQIADYEEAGEPDGCYHCGSQQHKTSDCHT